MDIDFAHLFKITVTPEEVVAHYANLGITDYPKNANGMPNMKLNKQARKIIYADKEKRIIKQYEEMIEIKEIKRKERMAEAFAFRIDTSKNEDCPICLEPMSGRSILECTHVFCIKCSIEHFRTKQNCPLCRAEVCGPPKKGFETLQDQTISSMVEDNLGYVYPERHNLDLYNFILTSASIFRESPKANAFHFTNDIFDEVRKFGIDVATDVKNWYEES
jgi:hypothetical protein